MSATPSFAELVDVVRMRIDASLPVWLGPRLEHAASISPEAGIVAASIADLSLRGGKRLRAALVAVGFEAQGPAESWEVCEPALMAVELLQTYLLIHDDWMDNDDVRRGGPAVHVLLRERLGDELGAAGAILAGDLASAYAQEALLETKVPAERLLCASRAFARTQVEVVTGQLAEMHSPKRVGPGPSVETIHAMKTASYTVTGPLKLGAALAGADDARSIAIERFGRPLGVAFQLRDDLLGVFGDPTATGKPVWNDVRQGKRTALVEELAGDTEAEAMLSRIHPASSDAEVEAIVRRMETSGARTRVEARVRTLSAAAREALDALEPLSACGRTWLLGAVSALGERTS